MKVGVIDYGVGNLGSVVRAFEELRAQTVLVNRPVDMHAVDALVLPGVGNFSDCARLLDAGHWRTALHDEVLGYRRPMLGVCLGMQLLASGSSEGSGEELAEGLGFIPGKVRHLRELGCELRTPHVGWNSIQSTRTERGLFNGIPDGTDFYFVHGYAFVPDDPAEIVATTNYGIEVTAAVQRGHIWGTQFHPEKSSRAGFRLLQNFLAGPAC